MARHRLTMGLLLGALLTLGGSPAHAGRPQPKPMVLLLVDTSGSMQDAVNASSEGELPVCHSTRQAGFDYVRSRWAAVVEVLTGTFKSYWCSYDERSDTSAREDYLATPAHVMPRGVTSGGSQQNDDGLIDLYEETIKFALMAYDSNPDPRFNRFGAFSYGPTLGSGASTINLGARNASAVWGALVSPTKHENKAQLRMSNDTVQSQILGAKPYGSTPIAPMLQDALYFFQNDNNVKRRTGGSGQGLALGQPGDPYYDCRGHRIILISDGSGNMGEAADGYSKTSAQAAADLLAAGFTVDVIAFQTPADVTAALDAVAAAGGTGSAYAVASQAELRMALGEILAEDQEGRQLRTRSTVTTRTLDLTDRQYQFFATYGTSTACSLDLTGYLDQFIYRCEDSCRAEGESDYWAGLCEIFSISGKLASQVGDRRIETQLDGQLESFVAGNTDITAELLAIPTSGELPQLEPVVQGGQTTCSGNVLGDASVPDVRAEYRNQLIGLIRADADSRRASAPLGAIVHPRVVLQPDLSKIDAGLASFNAYRAQEEILYRPTTLFVGTNDGLLHAFRVDRLAIDSEFGEGISVDDFGRELWAFIPRHLLSQLNNQATSPAYLMDGHPTVAEVRLRQPTVGADLADEVALWRSVLVTGYGAGGRGYVALNVTDPVNYEFMWELSNSERCFNVPGSSSGCAATTDFARLGKSYSQPAVGSLFYTRDAVTAERAVAIFGGGGPVDGDAAAGYALFVVDLETGALVKEFCNSCGNIVDTSELSANTVGLDCPLTGPVAAYDASVGSYISRAFIGDSCGQLWRLHLRDIDPAAWRLELFHDAYSLALNDIDRRPISFPPALALGAAYGQMAPVLVYGTGSPDEAVAEGETDLVYSLSEEWADSTFTAKVNWRIELEEAESFSSEAVVFDRVAYFTTYATGADGNALCAADVGRLWGVNFVGSSREEVDDVIGALDPDGLLETVEDLVTYVEYPDTELPAVDVVMKPSCMVQPGSVVPWVPSGATAATSPPLTMPYPSGVGGGTAINYLGTSGGDSGVQLVVQTGTTASSTPDMQAPSGGGVSATGGVQSRQLARPPQSVFSTSWGLVFD